LIRLKGCMVIQSLPVFVRQAALAALFVLSLGLASPSFGQSGSSVNPQQLYELARQLLRGQRADKAFLLLAPHEAELAGDKEYDYLLGVTALDSKRPGRAIFSLQRLVASQPNFPGGHLELARAYFNIGDNELARIEFDRVLAQNPPANVVALVSSYQKAILARAASYTTTSDYFLEFGGGYDTNAPAATDQQLFLGFLLDERNLEQSSSLTNLAVGGAYNRPLTSHSQLQIAGSLGHRSNASAHFVDTTNLNLAVAWNWREKDNGFSIGANNVLSALDQKFNRRDTELATSYLRQINKELQLTGFLSYGVSRFEAAALRVRDIDLFSVGAALTHSSASDQLKLMLTSNNEDATQNASPFSSEGYGLRLTKTWFRPRGIQYFAEMSYQDIDFSQPFFGINRADEVVSLTVGTAWPGFPFRDWMTSAWVGYSEKHSSVNLFEYQRTEALVSFRRLFK
jgi:tetratricopeptide (TPR) repeat protein